jgi:predicted transcriptional regulator
MVEDCDASPVLVRDLMTVGVATCSPQAMVVEIARLFLENGWEAVIVLDAGEGHALGVITQDELVKAYARPDVCSLKAEEIMFESVPQVPPDIPLVAAAQMMRDKGVRALFIMHHAGGVVYPAAMISYQHILRHLAAHNPEELRDLGIHAQRQSPLQAYLARREAARKRNQSN